MLQRRSRRIEGQEPSLVDDETARVIITELIKRGYSEERAHEIAYEDDPEWKELFFQYLDLKAKGFDEDQALDLAENGKASAISRIYDNFLPMYADDGQATAKFVMLYIEMLDDQLELNDGPLFYALTCAQKMLTDSTLRLKQGVFNERGNIVVGVGGYSDLPLVLVPSEITLPAWRKLAAAISSTKREGVIHLCVTQLELGREVSDMLLEASMGTSPLKYLSLLVNNLFDDGCGVEFVANILKANPSLTNLCIERNLGESEKDAQSLVNALIDHPKLDIIGLEGCGLGSNESVMKSIVPLLGSLNQISLAGNQIGSLGVKLISDCLASNPMLSVLSLKDDLLNDVDADILSNSLKNNTNLRILRIAGNSISQVGMKSFHSAVQNLSSFNAMSDSNHTCLVIDGGKELSNLNTKLSPKVNKTLKIMNILVIEANMTLLSIIPIELIPRVLYLVQGRGFFETPSLSRTFRFIRQWSMPLLYTSCIGFEPRRSERVRKKMVMKYIVVK